MVRRCRQPGPSDHEDQGGLEQVQGEWTLSNDF